jgi:Holliday junction resolvase RusA-like endonuclease
LSQYEQTLLWTPRAKQRARTAFRNGQLRTFTPRETVAAEAALAEQWAGPTFRDHLAVMLVMSNEDIRVVIEEVGEPESAKLRKGDIDNYSKTILDALNGKAWRDDRQIARLYVVKT